VLGCRGPPELTRTVRQPSCGVVPQRTRPGDCLLRKLAAALLAVPVLALIYLPVLARRSIATRIAMALGVGSLVAVGAFGLVTPRSTVATPPLPPIVPLTNTAFTSTVAAGTGLDAPVSITFSAPMDQTSVAASLSVEPAVSVELSWDATGTRLTITPTRSWAPATYHTITVRPGAMGASGRPMAVPARAVFLTRSATVGRIEATSMAGAEALVSTTFRISFDRPVALSAVRGALKFVPALSGELEVAQAPGGSSVFVFTPSTPLAPATAYTVSIVGLKDAAGSPLAVSPTLAVSTGAAPRVVRFRPVHGTKNVDQAAALSVRFTQPMDRKSTKAAFTASIGGKAIAGAVSFAENDTVLIFKPTGLLPYGAMIEMLVNDTAYSAAGARIEAASSVRITVEAKPTAAARTSSSGYTGGAVGGGSWGAVETFYLGIMNCTRTGGWVTTSGTCSSPGGRSVAPLKLDSGISTNVSRPYAKRLATSGQCSHFIGGNPGDRLRAAGYTSYIWAENLGCRSGNPKTAVLGSHLYFQSEKSYLGGHYVNMMNAKYDRVGIGVWVYSSRVRLVVDFYHPR
jgi:hypothetical protein